MSVRCSKGLMRSPELQRRGPAGIASRARRLASLSLTGAILVASFACRSAAPLLTRPELEAAIARLDRPLPGDPAALYKLKIPNAGGLRLSVRTSGEAGRLTVSEAFGSALSITAWEGSRPATFFDLREGCRLEASDLSQVLGVPALPMPEAVRLLAGRLPSSAGDRVSPGDDGRILVEGSGWAALVRVATEPWRVVEVTEAGGRKPQWRFELSDHSASVPGVVRVAQREGRRAELALIRLEWKDRGALPGLPDLPSCTSEPPS